MKKKMLSLVTSVGLCALSSAAGAATIYQINDLTGYVTGTITTDGVIGTLGVGDIQSWNLSINGSTIPYVLDSGDGNPTNYKLLNGSALTATATTLSWNNSIAGAYFELGNGPPPTGPSFHGGPYGIPYGMIQWSTYELLYYNEGNCGFPVAGVFDCLSASFGGSPGTVDIANNGVSDSATPLPGALPLFATGLGALGLLGWRRKKKAAA